MSAEYIANALNAMYSEIVNTKSLVQSNHQYVYRDISRLIQTNISTAALHQKTFLPFKAKHRGQKIVVCGTGPSAKSYEPIPDAIHIGCNRFFEFSPVPLDYVFIQDYSGATPEYISQLNTYEPERCTKFYGLTTEWGEHYRRVIPESDAIVAGALRYRTDLSPLFHYNECQFAYDVSTQPLGCFGSVAFSALQFAIWTYPAEIYLVGCDCTTSGYFYSDDQNTLMTDRVIDAHKKFKHFAKVYYPDVRIISINPVGLVGVYEDKNDGG